MAHAVTVGRVGRDAGVVVGVAPIAETRARVDRVALLALLAGVITTASGALLVRFSETGPSATAAYRMGLAALAVWPLVSHRGPVLTSPTGGEWRWGVVAGLFFAADLAVWHWSLLWTTVANASLLGNLAPLFVTLAAWGFLGQRPSRAFLAGLATVMIGAACLGGGSLGLGGRHVAGDVLALGAAVFYAGYLLAVKRLRAVWSTTKVVAVTGPWGAWRCSRSRSCRATVWC